MADASCAASHPSVVISLGEGASLRMLQQYAGPAGAAYDPQKSHTVVKFGGPHAKVSTLSPGPAKYDPSQIALHQVSTQRRAPSSHIFSRQSAWNAEPDRSLEETCRPTGLVSRRLRGARVARGAVAHRSTQK